MSDSRLEKRLASLESRLSKIESRLGATSAPPPPPSAKVARAIAKAPPPPAYPTEATEEKPGNWLGIVAVICFVLAAGFIIKLSVESGWLTPVRQVGMATLLGLGLIGAGLTLLRADRGYASFLPAAGVIVLYLSTFAAHRYYPLISFESGLASIAIVSGLCVWLYTVIRHDIYAITAAVGAYLSPNVLGFDTNATFSLLYFLCCSVAFACISTWVKSRTLTLVSSYLAILVTGWIGLQLHEDRLVTVMLALHFFTFSAGTYLYSRYNNTALGQEEAWGFLPVLLIFYAMEYYFVDRIAPGRAPLLSLGFAAFLFTLYLSARRFFPDSSGSQALVLAFTSVVCFHSFYLELLPGDMRPWLFVIIMLGFALFPASVTETAKGDVYRIPMAVLMLVLGIEYLSILFHLFDANSFSWLVVAFAAFVSVWAAIVRVGETDDGTEHYGHALLSAAHMLAVMGLYRLTTDAGSLAVSASWLFYAVGVMVFAFGRRDEVMAKSALFVLGFAAGKALLYDAASAPTVVRIVCLLLTGVVLYSCGLFMRQISNWKNN